MEWVLSFFGSVVGVHEVYEASKRIPSQEIAKINLLFHLESQSIVHFLALGPPLEKSFNSTFLGLDPPLEKSVNTTFFGSRPST